MNIERDAPITTELAADTTTPTRKMDYLFFISDAAERNVLAAILKEKKDAFGQLDYMAVFSGASLPFIEKEPFTCLLEDRKININDLGLDKVIDAKWDRQHVLSPDSIKRIVKVLQVQKAVITGPSQNIFIQIHSEYKEQYPHVRRVAIWENPNRSGNTTYFSVGLDVAKTVSEILVPSEFVAEKMRKVNPEIKATVVGVPALEDFEKQARAIDKEAVYTQVGIDPTLPVIVISGATDSTYTAAFTAFIRMLGDNTERKLQLIVQPHPSYTGTSERELCKEKESELPLSKLIVSSAGKDDESSLSTVKALAIADIVVCTDPTSLVVFQAASIGKQVVLFNPAPLKHLKQLLAKGVFERVSTCEEMVKVLDSKKSLSDASVYEKMKIPKGQGFQPFWEALVR